MVGGVKVTTEAMAGQLDQPIRSPKLKIATRTMQTYCTNCSKARSFRCSINATLMESRAAGCAWSRKLSLLLLHSFPRVVWSKNILSDSISQPRRSSRKFLRLQAKTNFQFHLKLIDLPILYQAACFADLEPIQVFERLIRAADRVLDCILNRHA